MASKSKYYVTFIDEPFDSLKEAKYYIEISFTRKAAKKFLTHAHEMIYRFNGDRLCSQTPIYVDEVGNISFGRTHKLY